MIAALLLAAAPIDLAPDEPKPLETTIAAVRAAPAKFDGRTVRLHGYVSRCSAMDCTITERPADAPAGSGAWLSIAPDAKFDATVQPLLPTFVEFDARVDASCLVQVCTGRAPVLTIVTLRGVISPEPPQIEN